MIDSNAILKVWKRRDRALTELAHHRNLLNHRQLTGKNFWFEHEQGGWSGTIFSLSVYEIDETRIKFTLYPCQHAPSLANVISSKDDSPRFIGHWFGKNDPRNGWIHKVGDEDSLSLLGVIELFD